MDKILAKSGVGAPTLAQHTVHVMDAAEALFGTAEKPSRLGRKWLDFFKLSSETWPTFHANLLAASAMHDWGKANNRMQDVLAGKPNASQAIRHEHFSAMLIAQPVCWKWLGERDQLHREMILSAVLTHHLKAAENVMKVNGFANGGQARSFSSLHGSDEFELMVQSIADRLNLPPLDMSGVANRWAFDGAGMDIIAERDRIQQTILQPFKKRIDPRLENDSIHRRLLHAVRSGLIVSDAAGSGLVRVGKTIPNWIAEQFDESKVWGGQDVWTNVIEKRKRQVELQRGRVFAWNDFQNDCADSTKVPARALLMAPCGSGKTLAAWRWIAARLAEQPSGHILFLYPTRATATEGFRDYVSWAPEADASLMHGTSGFDLVGMFGNESDPRNGMNYEAERRLFALGYWGRRAFSATIDQFLAFMSFGYGPMCMLPVLADSVVVIDEVHSFDRNMFSALKEFLKNFHVPVLCMTATLPMNRREELTKPPAEGGCGLTLYDRRPEDLKKIADEKRYRLRRIASLDEAEAAVRLALKSRKRVLWVVNTVNRAHAVIARFVRSLPPDSDEQLRLSELQTTDGIPVICYHSRFRLSDRVTRHQATMRALKDQPGPALGVTTQVCEMSLDIDADLLISEDCPVTSLVQRMGRCNRDQTPRPLGSIDVDGTAGDVLVYEPTEQAPYDDDQLQGLPEFLRLLDGRDLSQSDLETAMEDKSVPCPPSLGDTLCPFLESGPYAVGPRSDDDEANTFREGNDFNRPCVLAKDVIEFLGPDPERTRQPGFVLPVPKKYSWQRDPANPDHARLPGYLGVAKDEHYHRAVGFCDAPISEWGTH